MTNTTNHQPGLPVQPTPSTSPAHVKRMDGPFVLEGGGGGGGGGGEEMGFPDEATSIEDQDEAQAALQPAISAAASHLTSAQTPAAEKAAALERVPGGGYFHNAIVRGEEEDEDDDDDDDGSRSSPNGAVPSSPGKTPRPLDETRDSEAVSPGSQVYASRPRHHVPGRLPMPSPWTSGPKSFLVNKDSPRTRQTKGLLGSAFGPTRQHRSRSAGQEAFKKLQKAFPSFGGHAGLFPSLPASFLSNLTGDHKHGSNAASKSGDSARPRSLGLTQQSTTAAAAAAATTDSDSSPGHSPPASEQRLLSEHTSTSMSTSMSRPRPPTLRRVTSDESMLYHSLSRQSSLGDDNKFDDVREMVNIRFMAIKDSLPDVPNFRMPSLARLQAASRMSSMALNGLFSSSNDDQALSRRSPDAGREMPRSSPSPSSPKPSTAAAATAFDRVVEKLTGDVVILGGYRGSVLRSAEPPHQQLWAPVKLGFNMRKANLEVGLEDEDEETMEERIIPSGMLKHVGPVDVSRKLFKRLRSSPNARNGSLRIWDFGYDWRLSPALSSRKLQEFLSKLPSNRPGTSSPESRGALVIAHSLGGPITRHAVNNCPELFAGVLYAGVPQRCINILGPFRNGDAVLFNEKLLTAQVNFSIRTSFVLLPDDGFCFIDRETGESYPVDFFNADDWVRWHLSPCVAPLLPPYSSRDKQQSSSSPLSSLIPNSLLKNKKPIDPDIQSSAATAAAAPPPPAPSEDHHHHKTAPLPSPPQSPSSSSPPSPSGTPGATASDQQRYMNYLRRTLAATRKFRSELAHSKELESVNAYPPHAVLYGKTIPTVYAAQVAGREAISYADAYDDLVFRPGDGVVLAREAMLPEGYAIVRSGRVSTERGHLTMLGDLAAVARALEALLWGRQRGIGMGKRDKAQVRQ